MWLHLCRRAEFRKFGACIGRSGRSKSAGGMPVKVFISYSHLDGDLVFGEIKPLLQAAPGVQITLDEDDFAWGGTPQKSMEDAVRACDFTIAVMTQHYVDGQWTMHEATVAIELERLVPIVFQ